MPTQPMKANLKFLANLDEPIVYIFAIVNLWRSIAGPVHNHAVASHSANAWL